MADKRYVAIFVPPKVRIALKKQALVNERTMIEELSVLLKVKSI